MTRTYRRPAEPPEEPPDENITTADITEDDKALDVVDLTDSDPGGNSPVVPYPDVPDVEGPNDRLVSAAEAGELVGVHRNRVLQWKDAKLLPVAAYRDESQQHEHRVGKAPEFLFRLSDVERVANRTHDFAEYGRRGGRPRGSRKPSPEALQPKENLESDEESPLVAGDSADQDQVPAGPWDEDDDEESAANKGDSD